MKINKSFIRVLAALLICAFAACTFCACQSKTEESEVDTVNHLKDSMWKNDTGYMRYADKDYSSLAGVDVSEWNGDIDWERVREAGIKFAIIRLG